MSGANGPSKVFPAETVDGLPILSTIPSAAEDDIDARMSEQAALSALSEDQARLASGEMEDTHVGETLLPRSEFPLSSVVAAQIAAAKWRKIQAQRTPTTRPQRLGDELDKRIFSEAKIRDLEHKFTARLVPSDPAGAGDPKLSPQSDGAAKAKASNHRRMYRLWDGNMDRAQLEAVLQNWKEDIRHALFGVIAYDNRYKYMWDMSIIGLTLYSIIIIPLQMAFATDSANATDSALKIVSTTDFDLPEVFGLVGSITDVVFVVDVYLNFRTAYLDEDRYEVTDSWQIVRHYLHTWFAVDLLACLQLDFMLRSAVPEVYQIFFPINKLARITRVVKRLDEMVLTGYWRIAKLLGTFLAMAHVIGCMFFALGRIEANFEGSSDEAPSNWLEKYEMKNQTTTYQYTSSLYWAFATLGTVGYGDIAAVSFYERLFTIVVMFWGSIMYASIFGTFTNLIQERDRHRNQYNERVSRIKDFVRANQLPRFIRDRLVRYHEATWQLRKVLVGDVMEGVPASAQIEIMVFLYMDLVRTVPIFSRCSQRLLEKVVMCFTQDIFLSGDYLMRQGDDGRELFFIVKGRIDVFAYQGQAPDISNMDFDDIIKDSYFIVSRGPGAFIGEGSLLYGDRRGATVRAVSNVVQTLTLTKTAFESCVRDSPEVLKMMRSVASRRAQENSDRKTMSVKQGSANGFFSTFRKSMEPKQPTARSNEPLLGKLPGGDDSDVQIKKAQDGNKIFGGALGKFRSDGASSFSGGKPRLSTSSVPGSFAHRPSAARQFSDRSHGQANSSFGAATGATAGEEENSGVEIAAGSGRQGRRTAKTSVGKMLSQRLHGGDNGEREKTAAARYSLFTSTAPASNAPKRGSIADAAREVEEVLQDGILEETSRETAAEANASTFSTPRSAEGRSTEVPSTDGNGLSADRMVMRLDSLQNMLVNLLQKQESRLEALETQIAHRQDPRLSLPPGEDAKPDADKSS